MVRWYMMDELVSGENLFKGYKYKTESRGSQNKVERKSLGGLGPRRGGLNHNVTYLMHEYINFLFIIASWSIPACFINV